ncbi:MAG: helix-turn-helix transcriptional regulator [Actinobacteria bacterium]|nr:helix-turn-helix transcriptional regulator [Actinomycetota bacterium]
MKEYFHKISFASQPPDPPPPPSSPPLTSAAALRALGHPTRLRLLARLQLHGDSTATECADEVEESASSCSYHLRALAKHGFVEQVPTSDGRERRWRARVASVDFAAGAEADEEFQAASALARAALLQVSDEAVADYLQNERSFSAAWREAAAFLQTTIVATPAELEEIAQAIQTVLRPFQRSERDETPRAARFVHVGVRAVPRS